MELDERLKAAAAVQNHWQNLVLCLVQKLGGATIISEADLTALPELFPGDKPCLTMENSPEGLVLKVCPIGTARQRTQPSGVPQ